MYDGHELKINQKLIMNGFSTISIRNLRSQDVYTIKVKLFLKLCSLKILIIRFCVNFSFYMELVVLKLCVFFSLSINFQPKDLFQSLHASLFFGRKQFIVGTLQKLFFDFSA